MPALSEPVRAVRRYSIGRAACFTVGAGVDLLLVLMQFLFRVTGGMACAMALTSPRLVTSGYFRNHLYVTLGFMVLASLIAGSDPTRFSLWPPIAAAAISYIGAVCWLYEAAKAGRLALLGVTATAGCGAWQTVRPPSATEFNPLWIAEPFTSAWVLGTIFAAMLLGHWYLNTPGMKLAPLRRLLLIAGAGCLLRGICFSIALAMTWSAAGRVPDGWPFWVLHGTAGLIGTLVMIVMAWETLKVPNTQSATGILYVGVIFSFLGETAGMLISLGAPYPL